MDLAPVRVAKAMEVQATVSVRASFYIHSSKVDYSHLLLLVTNRTDDFTYHFGGKDSSGKSGKGSSKSGKGSGKSGKGSGKSGKARRVYDGKDHGEHGYYHALRKRS